MYACVDGTPYAGNEELVGGMGADSLFGSDGRDTLIAAMHRSSKERERRRQ